jgi:CRP-like cAMP-binding protein
MLGPTRIAQARRMKPLPVHNPHGLHAHLARTALFNSLEPGEIETLCGDCSMQPLLKGEALFRTGSHPRHLYSVLEGHVALTVSSPSGAEKVVDIVGPHQHFGEALLFMEWPSPVTASALEDSRVVALPRERLFQLIEQRPGFVFRLLSGLSVRLHHLVADLEAYCLMSSTQRVIGYLLSEADQECPAGSAVEVRLSATKQVIASRLNLTPETFSRTLHQLTEAGLIQVEGRSIIVSDMDKLREFQRCP